VAFAAPEDAARRALRLLRAPPLFPKAAGGLPPGRLCEAEERRAQGQRASARLVL